MGKISCYITTLLIRVQQGREIKGNDHQEIKVAIVNTSPFLFAWKWLESSVENMHARRVSPFNDQRSFTEFLNLFQVKEVLLGVLWNLSSCEVSFSKL